MLRTSIRALSLGVNLLWGVRMPITSLETCTEASDTFPHWERVTTKPGIQYVSYDRLVYC